MKREVKMESKEIESQEKKRAYVEKCGKRDNLWIRKKRIEKDVDENKRRN